MADDQQASRREFLRGRSALRALWQRTHQIADDAAKSLDAIRSARGAAAESGPLTSVSRRAMATEFVVEVRAAAGGAATEAALAALDTVARVEDQLTVYREWSETIDVNQNAALRPVQVESRLFRLLRLCQWLHQATGGAFDPTSGPLSRTWGFFARDGRFPNEAERIAALDRVGFGRVLLDEAAETVQFAEPGVELNFNSIGKGYALDLAAAILLERGVDDFLIHGGRSSVVACGSPEGDAAAGWAIGVPHPLRPGENVGQLRVVGRGLGTAGSATQHFEHEGRRYGHVLDPRTGWPAEGVHTATVVAPTGAEADALATALYVLGPGGAAEYCAAHDDVAAVLVCPGAGEDEYDVHAFNLGPTEWTRTDG
ncbi:MAG: FAD:protein FMN transferase [Pirellulales bacterium]|nr:FAD:protein FMN transferase [Pirellulales bacterium]